MYFKNNRRNTERFFPQKFCDLIIHNIIQKKYLYLILKSKKN